MYLAIVLIFSICVAAECEESTDAKIAKQQAASLSEAQAQTGMPAITNWQEKKTLKALYEMRDDAKLVCYAYIWSPFTSKFTYIGKCMGFGIPYATQYSNPEVDIFQTTAASVHFAMPQA